MNVVERMFLCQEKRAAFVIKSYKGYHFQSRRRYRRRRLS